MIGIDTNILVRYLAQDDPLQSPRATAIMERQFDSENPGFISIPTIIETFWVLHRIFDLEPPEIAKTFTLLLQAENLAIQNEQEVFSALAAVKTGTGSFPDALIGALGLWAGCSSTLTFDKKAKRLPGFTHIGSG